MTQWLKQSTAATLKFGPFVDTDGAPVTGLTISQADIRLSKNGGNIAQTNDATGATHDELGFYDIPLDATDTGTLGRLLVAVSESGALLAWQHFMVVPANVWDSMFGGTDTLDVQVTGIGANVITATSINADAITAAKLANGAIDAATFAADVDAEVLSYLVDDATRIDASALNTATVTSVPAILVDTADMQPKIGTPVTDLAADIAVIEGQTDDIGAAGAGLTAITAKTGNLPADPADQSAVEAKIDTIKSRVI